MSLIQLFLLLSCGNFFLSQVQANGNELNGSNDLSTAMTNIISHIRRGELHEADEKILQWVNVPSANIELIVSSVYANNSENFNLLIRYSRSSSSVKISQAILTALWREMKINDHMHFFSVTVLYKTFFISVIKRAEKATDEMKAEAMSIRNEIRRAVISAAVKRLRDAVFLRNYRNNNNIQMVANILPGISKSISDATYYTLINEVYDKVATEDLIQDMCSNQNANQVVTSLASIYMKIERSRHVSSRSVTLMAGCLTRLHDTSTFMKLSQEKKNHVTSLIGVLPDYIRNLYFAEKVCIRNAFFSEYLYSPAKDFGYTVDGAGKMRYVFALHNGSLDEHSHWIAKKDNDNDSVFTFMSDAYRNEFMFVSESTSYIMGYSDVATWIPGGTKGNQSSWEVRVDDENIYLLNLHFNTLLCIDGVKHAPTQRRLVFAKDFSQHAEKCEWIIESCGGKN